MKPVNCTRCKRECFDFRQVSGGARICILCVQDELQGRIAELERAKSGRLHVRLAHAQATLTQIERACAWHGYDPESGVFVADWIAARLGRVEALPPTWRSRYVDRHFSGAVVECADELERALRGES